MVKMTMGEMLKKSDFYVVKTEVNIFKNTYKLFLKAFHEEYLYAERRL